MTATFRNAAPHSETISKWTQGLQISVYTTSIHEDEVAIDHPEAVRLAGEFPEATPRSEVPLVVDIDQVIVHDGALIAPCNSEEFIHTERFESMVIGCTPVRVDLTTGECRFLTFEECETFDL